MKLLSFYRFVSALAVLLNLLAVIYLLATLALMLAWGDIRLTVVSIARILTDWIPFGLGGIVVIPLGLIGALRLDFIFFAVILFLASYLVKRLGFMCIRRENGFQ